MVRDRYVKLECNAKRASTTTGNVHDFKGRYGRPVGRNGEGEGAATRDGTRIGRPDKWFAAAWEGEARRAQGNIARRSVPRTEDRGACDRITMPAFRTTFLFIEAANRNRSETELRKTPAIRAMGLLKTLNMDIRRLLQLDSLSYPLSHQLTPSCRATDSPPQGVGWAMDAGSVPVQIPEALIDDCLRDGLR